MMSSKLEHVDGGPLLTHHLSMHLLLIDDERKVARFIARSLRENCYTVDVSETGEKGLEMASRINYDAILLDLRLPRMSGLQVCRELRDSGNESPILMLTARTMVEQRVEGLDAGADDYLTKPFAIAELLARVRALVRRRLNDGGRLLHHANLEMDRHQRRVSRAGKPIPLTAKELSLLEFLLTRAPETVSRR